MNYDGANLDSNELLMIVIFSSFFCTKTTSEVLMQILYYRTSDRERERELVIPLLFAKRSPFNLLIT